MSGVTVPPRHIATYITLFDEAILWSQTRGLTGDWSKLRERLDAISQRVSRDADIQREVPDWAYRLEHRLLIEVLREALLSVGRDDLVGRLRSQRPRDEPDSGVWAALELKGFQEEQRRHRKRALSADIAAFAALEQHVRKPSHRRILEGLQALEVLQAATLARDPLFDAELLRREGRHLVEALRELLPPTARRLVGSRVEDRFRSELEGVPVGQLAPAPQFWHHKVPDLGVWYPVWAELRLGDDLPDPVGTWFNRDYQRVYESWHAAAESARKGRKEEERRHRSALAQEERLRRKEAVEQTEQIRLRDEEALRIREQQYAPQVELEEARERFRRAGEIQRAWAESQFVDWCERQGVSPKAVTPESRARFFTGDLRRPDRN